MPGTTIKTRTSGIMVPCFVAPVASGGCAEATAFLARTSGLDVTHTNAYTTLICGLVTDGVWSQLDALYIFATADATTANLNLKSTSFPITGGTTTPAFTADRGYKGNGTTDFLKTGFVPSTAGGNYTLNAASFGFYDRTNSTDTSATQMGIIDSTDDRDQIVVVAGGSNTSFRINITSADFVNVSYTTDTSGMYAVRRSASNAYKAFRFGNNAGTATDAAISTNLPDVEFYICAVNQSGVGTGLTTDQIAAAFIGGGLSDTDVTNLAGRINTYMTTVGANVY